MTVAIELPKDLAGDRVVAVNAGEVGSGLLAAGLADDVAIHLLDDPHVVVGGERVLHLRFRVRRSTTAGE